MATLGPSDIKSGTAGRTEVGCLDTLSVALLSLGNYTDDYTDKRSAFR